MTQVENMARTIVALQEGAQRAEERERNTFDALEQARREADELRAALNDVWGTLLAYYTDIPEAEVQRLIAKCAALAGVQAKPNDLAHWTHRMLQALDAYWLHYDGYDGRGNPRSESTGEDWWHRFERYRARVEGIIRG
jgi:hypothetical protein